MSKWFDRITRQKQQPPVPPETSAALKLEEGPAGPRRSGIYINQELKMLRVDLFYDASDPDCLARALGSLEMAKDVLKQAFSQWRMQDARRPGIVVPRANGNGSLRVQ